MCVSVKRRRPHFLAPLVGADADTMALYVDGVAVPIASQLEGAFSSETRKRGLLGRASMPADLALVIAPCNAVHTFKMQFAIDLIYAARDGRVLKVREAVGPNRVSAAIGAFATIEMAAGAIARFSLVPGQTLHVRKR